jgi:hypothetical protein
LNLTLKNWSSSFGIPQDHFDMLPPLFEEASVHSFQLLVQVAVSPSEQTASSAHLCKLFVEDHCFSMMNFIFSNWHFTTED